MIQSMGPAVQAIAARAASTIDCDASESPPARSNTRSLPAPRGNSRSGCKAAASARSSAPRCSTRSATTMACMPSGDCTRRSRSQASMAMRSESGSRAACRQERPASACGSARSIFHPFAARATSKLLTAGVSRRITGDEDRRTRGRHGVSIHEVSREVGAIAGRPGAQFALDGLAPAEKGLLVASQGPARKLRQVAAVGAQPQPARARPLPQVARIKEARRVPCRLAPEPMQGRGRQDAGQRGPVGRGLLPLLQKPGIERQHLGRWPDLASRGDLRAIVQPAQDASLAQVARQQQAASLEMGDAPGIRIQSTASLTPAPA